MSDQTRWTFHGEVTQVDSHCTWERDFGGHFVAVVSWERDREDSLPIQIRLTQNGHVMERHAMPDDHRRATFKACQWADRNMAKLMAETAKKEGITVVE